MSAIWTALSGWKTHLVTTVPALVLVALVVAEKSGIDIPGFVIPTDWIGLVLGGLGFGALRSAVATK